MLNNEIRPQKKSKIVGSLRKTQTNTVQDNYVPFRVLCPLGIYTISLRFTTAQSDDNLSSAHITQ